MQRRKYHVIFRTRIVGNKKKPGLQDSTPWAKSSTSSSGSAKTPTSYKYDTTGVSRTSGNDARAKIDDEKKSTLRIQTPKFGNSAYTAGGYQRNNTATKDTGNYNHRSELPRLKPVLDKKDSLHPPVSYRPMTKTSSRSRDPSPVDRSERSTTSSNYNRLAPPPFRRSVSRERTNSTSSIGSISSTIPKYSGRLSSNQDDVSNFKKYSGITKADGYDDNTSRYKNIGRGTSRDDATASSKYITSRFLPKNTIERSCTGYSRGSSSLAKANEVSRKNREFLNVIQAQQDHGRTSRSVSRCSSVNFDDISQKSPRESLSETNSSSKDVEMESVNVITRPTSPTPTRSTSLLKSRRIEIAKTIEKQILRPKYRGPSIDKATQSDRLDDTTKNSKYAGASRISATPWNSILDMKFSSPDKKLTKSNSNSSENCSSEQQISRKKENSPSIEKSNSNKTIGHSCIPEDKSNSKKLNAGKNERKLLPPQIPTRDSSSKSLSMHFLSSQQNKDFRKSILNMSDMAKKKVGRRSNSVSSADSESENPKDSEATDISENLNSCRSFHNSASLNSKLPQKVNSEKNITNRTRRSPSSDLSLTLSSANTSSNEDEGKSKQDNQKTEQNAASYSSYPDCSQKLQSSNSTNNTEAKSFLIRALAPVTNIFKGKQQQEEKVKWILDSSSEGNSEAIPSHNDCSVSATHSPNSGSPQRTTRGQNEQEKVFSVPKMSHIPSGEIPWWLDESAEVPEGVQTYPNWVREDGTTEDGRVIYKLRKNDSTNSSWLNDTSENSISQNSNQIKKLDQTNDSLKQSEIDDYKQNTYKLRRNDSGKVGWWLDSSENSLSRSNDIKKDQAADGEYMVQKDENGRVLYKIRRNDSTNTAWWNDSSENSSNNKTQDKTKTLDSEYLDLHKIRHIDSGERSWWLGSQENIADTSEDKVEVPKCKIRHQDSGEPAWWLQNDDDGPENEDQVPLGDRASPEGLEMPRTEGRLSPYDNVPTNECKFRPNTLFISKHTNIDDLLGGSAQIWSPLMEKIFHYQDDSNFDQVDGSGITSRGKDIIIMKKDINYEDPRGTKNSQVE
ncbi:hypothetical protein WA026_018425, partial [Henosepilachna vigintioctopunctata]